MRTKTAIVMLCLFIVSSGTKQKLCLGKDIKLPGLQTRYYKGWEESYLLYNKTTELIVVPKIGRAILYRLKGKKNIFYANELNLGMVPDKKFKGYIFFGGLYTWLAPQSAWVDTETKSPSSWPPDSKIDRGPYKIEKKLTEPRTLTIKSKSKLCNLEIFKTYKLNEFGSGFLYIVSVHNKNSQPARWAIWNLVAVKPGIVLFATENGLKDLRFNIFNAKPKETKKLFDNIIQISKDNIAIVDLGKYKAEEGKFGVKPFSNFLAYRNEDTWMIRVFPCSRRKIYTDNNSQIEIYVNPKRSIYELEVLSPDRVIPPKKSIVWTERFYLFATKTKLTDPKEKILKELKEIIKKAKEEKEFE